MAVSSGQNGGQGNSPGVRNHVVFTPRFASVRWIGSRFPPHQPLGRTRYPPSFRRRRTNQSGQLPAVWTTKAHEASAKSPFRGRANHGDGASWSCPSRTPSRGVTSPRGCRSSGRTTLRSALAGRSKAFDGDSAFCEASAAATKVESVPIVHHLPVLPRKDQLPLPLKEKLLSTGLKA